MLFAVAMVGMFATSCKESFNEEDAIRLNQNAFNDSIQKKGALVNYTVQVVAVGDAANLKSANGLATGAIVTTVQYGKSAVDTVGVDGLAYFPAMRVGEVAVSIQLAGHTSVNALVNLTTNVAGQSISNSLTNAATQIAVFPITGTQTSTIKGRVTVQSDLTTYERELANGAIVTAYIDVNSSQFYNSYVTPATNTGSFATGQIQKISYSSALSTAVVTNGEYTLVIPSSAKGLPIKVMVSDYVVDKQKICLPTFNNMTNVPDAASGIVEEVRAVFKPGNGSSSIVNVDAAQVTIESPTGPIGNPTTAMTVTYGASGGVIVSYNITNQGAGYSSTNLPALVVATGNTSAILTPNSNLTANGGIQSITISNAGSNIATTTNGSVKVIMNAPNKVAKASVTVQDGVITGINLDDAGLGYIKSPSGIVVTILSTVSGKGTGAEAVVTGIDDDGAIEGLKIIKGGSGYFGKNNAAQEDDNLGGNVISYDNITAGSTIVLDIFFGTGTREVND